MTSFIQEKINDGKVVLWLPLTDGSFQDQSGNAHTVAPNGSKVNFDREGVKLQNQSYIEVTDANDLTFSNGTNDLPFTFAMWVKMYGTVDINPLFLKGSKVSYTLYEYRFGTLSNGKIILYLRDTNTGGQIGRLYNTPLTGYENQWIHLTGTYDGSGSETGIKIYLNGVRIDDSNALGAGYVTMRNNTDNLQIGKIFALYFNGTTKHNMVFNEALTETEIMQLMDETANMKYPSKVSETTKSLDLKELDSSGIKACYDMNTAGDQVIDSANGYDGTILNASKMNTPFGKGVLFDGVQSTIELPSLGYGTNDDFTVSGWVKTFDATIDQVLFNFGYDYTNYYGVAVEINGTGNNIRCYNRTLGTIATSFAPVEGVWYNITITNVGSTGEFKFYVNGELIDTWDFTDTPLQDRYLIGAHNVGFFKIVDGIIGPCQYWTRPLTPTEVADLYSRGKHLTYKSDWALSESDTGETEQIENSNWNIDSGTMLVQGDEINGHQVKALYASSGTMKIHLPLQNFMDGGSCMYGTWDFWVKHGSTDTWAIYLSDNLLDYPDYIGYRFGWWGSNFFFLSKGSGGGGSSDIFHGNESPPEDEWYNIKITRAVSGEFNIYKDGVLLTAATGTMPITDTTYTSAEYFKFNMTQSCSLAWSDKSGNYAFKKYEGVV